MVYVVKIDPYKPSFNCEVTYLHNIRIPLIPMWIRFLPRCFQEPIIVIPCSLVTTHRSRRHQMLHRESPSLPQGNSLERGGLRPSSDFTMLALRLARYRGGCTSYAWKRVFLWHGLFEWCIRTWKMYLIAPLGEFIVVAERAIRLRYLP